RVLTDGIPIVKLDDYDGRPSRRLVVCDFHNKGISKRSIPDPFLNEETLATLAILSGRSLVDNRLSMMRWACAQSQSPMVIISRRDAGGRDVVPPIQQPVELSESSVDPYGLTLALPERKEIEFLTIEEGEAPAQIHNTLPLELHLASQATAEWFRSGPWLQKRFTPLGDILAEATTPPEWVAPLLGYSPDNPSAALPTGEWSVTRLFEPLSHCMYQAFGTVVLNLKKAEEVSEELDPREIGQVVHTALEKIALIIERWPQGTATLEAAQRAFVDEMERQTNDAFAQAQGQLGELSPARRSAMSGQIARWNSHWADWARGRIRPAATIADSDIVEHFATSHPAFFQARHELLQSEPTLNKHGFNLKKWLLSAVRNVGRGSALHRESDEELTGARLPDGLPLSTAPTLRAFLVTDQFTDLVEVWRHGEECARALIGPAQFSIAELHFGAKAPAATMSHLG
ncbi:MAG: hypothetical protein HN348_33425, partial [Proteobacteria bacterium]|nr:hypothetical protein [Pseudomonadota bacterium]